MRMRMTCVATVATLALAGCASTSPGYGPGYGSTTPAPASGRCYDCGTVVAIETAAASDGKANVAGPVLGGIVGAVAAKELARRNTDSEGRRNVAIAAGAAGGAVAGNAIQNRVEGGRGGYTVHIRMDDGRTTAVHQADLGGIREGSYVRVQNGRAWVY
ncbi:peptidoglycan-associated outer membrane lipoprotein precursor [Luteimonas sp. M1R5S18]|uniref:Peptidoglycan-associated outer membrane lipoprotein n=1 Tax=Luteimonas rhizosphaericola TaxID=3042024 RepID=A0ABT6JH67_9GAMM|nr:peptidoglycan-associated outer membrane lipoprotein precursor [Luteimonas rhizosphaericola]MDH5829999.1 peptidoglycan-associated outer membrane lipoprotein precursor [Luteimonas rhizosphaericola]